MTDLQKKKRWTSLEYTRFVSTLPCCHCGAYDDTVVAHHLKGRLSPLSGGAGYKASDWLTMPLCHTCHTAAHNGDSEILDSQHIFILKTLDIAFRDRIIQTTYAHYKDRIDDPKMLEVYESALEAASESHSKRWDGKGYGKRR